jgi:hypothetical protein
MLELLNKEEQKALMELLCYMAKADGVVEDLEEEILEQYADLVEVDFSTLCGTLTPEELLPTFTNMVSRVVVLQELLRLSHLDGFFSDDEQSAILDLAAMMKIPMHMLEKVDQWVMDGINWSMRGEEILEEAEELPMEP